VVFQFLPVKTHNTHGYLYRRHKKNNSGVAQHGWRALNYDKTLQLLQSHRFKKFMQKTCVTPLNLNSWIRPSQWKIDMSNCQRNYLFLANVHVHVRYMSSPVRLSVCLLSNVRAPYSADWNFRQCFYAIWCLGHLWPFGKILRRSFQGNPPVGGAKHEG